nr:ankyrin repeat domain-containing protein 12-like [Penaeus vannamei]
MISEKHGAWELIAGGEGEEIRRLPNCNRRLPEWDGSGPRRRRRDAGRPRRPLADARADFFRDTRPLHGAAWRGRRRWWRAALVGRRPRCADANDETPLHLAAENGQKAVVEVLLSEGADPNAGNWLGNTAMHRAASGGHRGTLEALRASGADVDPVNSAGNTPLHDAASEGQFLAMGVLVGLGASPSKKNKNEETPQDLWEKLAAENFLRSKPNTPTKLFLMAYKCAVAEKGWMMEMQNKFEEELKKKQAEIQMTEAECEAKLLGANTAYNAKEDEAADLKKEIRDLRLEIGRKEDEIAAQKNKFEEELKKKQAEIQMTEAECEAKLLGANTAYNAKEDEAADLKKEIRDLRLEIGRKEDEIEAQKSRLEEELRKNRALARQVREKETELTQAEAEHEERVKSLKRSEKRKEKKAAEEKVELENKLRRRDKRIETLKKKIKDQEGDGDVDPKLEDDDNLLKRMKRLLAEEEEKNQRLSSVSHRAPEPTDPDQPSASGRRKALERQAGNKTPPAGACERQAGKDSTSRGLWNGRQGQDSTSRGLWNGRRERQTSASNWQKRQDCEGTRGRRASASPERENLYG